MAKKPILAMTLWLSRIRRGIPTWPFSPGLRFYRAAKLEIDELPVSPSTAQRLEASLRRGQSIEVFLTESCLLKKSLSIPKGGNTKLEKVVELNLRQRLPDMGQGVIAKVRRSQSYGGAPTADVWIVKKAHLADIEAIASRTGCQLRFIASIDIGDMLVFRDYRRITDRPRLVWGVLTASLPLVFVLVQGIDYYLNISATAEVRDRLTADIARLTEEAVAARGAMSASQEGQASVRADVARYIESSDRLGFLSKLTQALPDDTWTSELVLEGSSLRISCFTSNDVTIIIDLIRSINEVDSVDLEGAVSFDSFANQSRFELLVTLIPYPVPS